MMHVISVTNATIIEQKLKQFKEFGAWKELLRFSAK